MAKKMTLKQYIKKIEDCKKEYLKLCAEFQERYVKQIRVRFNKIQRESTKNWYGSYQPVSYKRFAYSLRNIPQIDIDTKTGKWEISFDSDRIKGFHRVTSGKGKKGSVKGGQEYMYETMFVGGWHGGATSGPPDKRGFSPFNTPGAYWRYPKDSKYPYWFEYPATRFRRLRDQSEPQLDASEYDVIDLEQADETSCSVRDQILSRFEKSKRLLEADIFTLFEKKVDLIIDKAKELTVQYYNQ